MCYRQGSSNCCSPEAQKHQCFHPLVLPRDVRKKQVSAKSWKKWKDGYKNENNKVVIVSFFVQALSQVKGQSMNYFVPDYEIFASWTLQVILRWYGYPTNISQRAPNCYTWFFAGSQTKQAKNHPGKPPWTELQNPECLVTLAPHHCPYRSIPLCFTTKPEKRQ